MRRNTRHTAFKPLSLFDFDNIVDECEQMRVDDACRLLVSMHCASETFNLLCVPAGSYTISELNTLVEIETMCIEIPVEFLGGFKGNVIYWGDLSMFVAQRVLSEYHHWGNPTGMDLLGLEISNVVD